MTKRAFISGISGQDGSYLAEHLLNLGYKVSGMVRRNSISENQTERLEGIRDKLHVDYGDVTDMASIISLLKTSKPHEIYHLAAQSHVKVSFKEPIHTSQTNAIGTLNLLEAARLVCPEARIYNAASSEMFGNNINPDGYQDETTRMSPVSPYGVSKLYAYNICRNYRSSYNMFISSGILFNHESVRRATSFVTTKIIRGALDIKTGKADKLVLGNLEASRDWGYAPDYVRGMHNILNHTSAEDFVLATGNTHTVRYLCEYVFFKLAMNYRNHVVLDEKFTRPEELNYLKGDSTKARKLLAWEPTHSFEDMINKMMEHWIEVYSI